MEYRIDNYLFEDEATYEKARKEAETIKYIRSRTDFSKPENAKKIINTIRTNNMFETALGLDFVAKLERLASGNGYPASETEKSGNASASKREKGEKASEPVTPAQSKAEAAADGSTDSSQAASDEEAPAFTADEEEKLREEVRRRTKHLKENAESKVEQIKKSYAIKARNLRIVIFALVLVIAGMLVITFFSDDSPFYNYEEAVLDKYSAWQEELKAKEQQLTTWEQELKEREDALKQ